MEALFSYISFEGDETIAEGKNSSKLTIDTQPDVFKNVVQMVRKASSIALNTIRRQKTHGKQTRKREFIRSFIAKQSRNIFESVTNVWTKGVARPLWNYGVDISLGLLRGSLTNFDHNLNMARLGEQSIGSFAHLTYFGTDLMTMKVTVDIEILLNYEREGREYVSQTQCWRYPVPAEDVHNLQNPQKVVIDCEWIIPQEENVKEKRKRIQSNASRKVIYYIHGGAYIIGTTALYRNWTSILAKTGECPVFAINYRLAPEHPFPSGLHDVFAGYMWLINPKHSMFQQETDQVLHEPYLPEEIIISGDSNSIFKQVLEVGSRRHF